MIYFLGFLFDGSASDFCAAAVPYPLSCDFWKEMCYAAGTLPKSGFHLLQFRIPYDAGFLSACDTLFGFPVRPAKGIRVELCNSQKSFAPFNVIFRFNSIDFYVNVC